MHLLETNKCNDERLCCSVHGLIAVVSTIIINVLTMVHSCKLEQQHCQMTVHLHCYICVPHSQLPPYQPTQAIKRKYKYIHLYTNIHIRANLNFFIV